MKLNFNSISAKLYRWFYNTSVMPTNICSYFWKLILMWIFIIPSLLFKIPEVLLYKYTSIPRDLGTIRLGVVFYLFLFFILSVCLFVTCLFTDYEVGDNSFVGILAVPGIIFSLAIVSVFIAGSLMYIYDMIMNYSSEKNVVVGFIKSKYNKYCAKIEWDKQNFKQSEHENQN